jgi:hypothetical protein
MACVNNPCPDMLPSVGMASPIVGDEYDGQISNLNNVAAHFSGGRRHHRKSSRKHHKKGGSLSTQDEEMLGGRRHRKSSRRHHKKGGYLSISEMGPGVLFGGSRKNHRKSSRKHHKKGGYSPVGNFLMNEGQEVVEAIQAEPTEAQSGGRSRKHRRHHKGGDQGSPLSFSLLGGRRKSRKSKRHSRKSKHHKRS